MPRRPPAQAAEFVRRARRLARDEAGNVIIYTSLTLAVLLGMVGLALDGSQAMITHSEAQAAADAAALAGASQLDMQTDACTRAKAEAGAVVNKQRFASTTGPAAVTIASSNCLSTLPASDSTAIPTTTADASGTASRFLQVTTQQLTQQTTFLNAVSANNQTLIQRKAVAGFRRSLCTGAPVMAACDSQLSWKAGVVFNAWNATGFGPYKDWLAAAGCGSSPCIQSTLGNLQPSFCVADSSIGPATGNHTNQAAAGVNTRFGQGSSASQPSDRDIMDFSNYSSEVGGKYAGTSGWNCKQYFSDNHKSDGLAAPASCSTTETSTTRYSVYQLERAGKNTIPAAGVPSTSYTTSVERRLAFLAVFNCGAGTPPEAFLKTFIIAPAVGANTKTAYVEPIGWATSQTDPTAVHEEVQLYR